MMATLYTNWTWREVLSDCLVLEREGGSLGMYQDSGEPGLGEAGSTGAPPSCPPLVIVGTDQWLG